MSQEAEPNGMTKKRVVYRLPGMDAVTVRQDVEYRQAETGALTMDLYYPSESAAPPPAVLFVTGYPDAGFQQMFGCKLKEMGSYVSWGRLAAVSGLVAITYTNQEPATDALAVLRYVRENAAALGIDANRIGVWSCSGNVPTALWVSMQESQDFLRCVVLCYGVMLDLDGSTGVAESAAQWRFANPAAGRSVEDLPQGLPLFIARAGRDEVPHLNESIDRFLAKALARNLPVTLVNHPEAPHAFDILQDSETTREIIRRILGFLRFHLAAQPGGGTSC
jgi:dienelactone hydrolase